VKAMEIAARVRRKAVEPNGLAIRLAPREAYQLSDALERAVAMLDKTIDALVDAGYNGEVLIEAARALLAELEGVNAQVAKTKTILQSNY